MAAFGLLQFLLWLLSGGYNFFVVITLGLLQFLCCGYSWVAAIFVETTLKLLQFLLWLFLGRYNFRCGCSRAATTFSSWLLVGGCNFAVIDFGLLQFSVVVVPELLQFSS